MINSKRSFWYWRIYICLTLSDLSRWWWWASDSRVFRWWTLGLGLMGVFCDRIYWEERKLYCDTQSRLDWLKHELDRGTSVPLGLCIFCCYILCYSQPEMFDCAVQISRNCDLSSDWKIETEKDFWKMDMNARLCFGGRGLFFFIFFCLLKQWSGWC